MSIDGNVDDEKEFYKELRENRGDVLEMKTSVVIVSRNDNYGGHLIERATICLKAMLETFDEVIYVDWNSEEQDLISEIGEELPQTEKLKYYIITPEQHTKFVNGDREAQKCVEVLARNIGIRRATGDIIVSSNIDIIPPSKEELDYFIDRHYRKDTFFTLARRNIEITDIKRVAKDDNWKGLKAELDENLWKILPKGPDGSWSRILGCGDFQLASKELWYKIKGFEEDMIYRMLSDSNVQMKAGINGYRVAAYFDVPIFHIHHDSGGGGDYSGKVNRNINKQCIVEQTKNTDDWGFVKEEFEEHII